VSLCFSLSISTCIRDSLYLPIFFSLCLSHLSFYLSFHFLPAILFFTSTACVSQPFLFLTTNFLSPSPLSSSKSNLKFYLLCIFVSLSLSLSCLLSFSLSLSFFLSLGPFFFFLSLSLSLGPFSFLSFSPSFIQYLSIYLSLTVSDTQSK